MTRTRKNWQEKLADDKDLPKVIEINDKMSKRWGTGTMVIPAPREVDEIMRRVPAGKLITVNEMRAFLARKHGAGIGCPMTTGIFAWVAAHAAVEASNEGKEDTTPYWRTLRADGSLNEKYPGGIATQTTRLKEEGHIIEPGKGKKPPSVKDFEEALFEL